MQQRPLTFPTQDGHRLEGRSLLPPDPRGGAVVCHPHPLFGGSMSSILIPLIQRALGARGWAALRFNYRGVGRSEGTYGHGRGEAKDVRAALDVMADAVGPDLPLAVVGWSFGALAGLLGAAGDPRVRAYVAVAPPVSPRAGIEPPPWPAPERLEGWDARVLAVCGTEDEICLPDDLARWAPSVAPGARVVVRPGEDHYFSNDNRALADLVASFVAET